MDDNEKIKTPTIYYSFAQYINEVVTLCHEHRLKYSIIGDEVFDRIGMVYPLYKITINPEAKISFGITSGIHPPEIAGPLAILEMLKEPHKYFHREICYSIYPILNPTGFDLKQRFNGHYRDLNAMYKTSLESKNYSEVQTFYEDIKNKTFDCFWSLHEDIDLEDFYLYIYDKQDFDKTVYKGIIEEVRNHVSILKNQNLYGAEVIDGLITNSFDKSLEQILSTHNKATISLCSETPGKLNIRKRIGVNLIILEFLNTFLTKNSI